MGRDRAAYMRQYRKRKATIEEARVFSTKWASERIAELEDEVRHLKAELAKRPDIRQPWPETVSVERFNTRPFTPVPKPRS